MRRNSFILECAHCRESVSLPEHRRAKAKYCSRACMNAARAPLVLNCKVCAKEYRRFGSEFKNHKDSNFCSIACRTAYRRAAPFGVNVDGYKVKLIDGKLLKEHRIVMACKLGRALLPHETVHHMNGDRADNRPENLELWSKSQPYGQRVTDKLAHAVQMLSQYGVDARFSACDVAAGMTLG